MATLFTDYRAGISAIDVDLMRPGMVSAHRLVPQLDGAHGWQGGHGWRG